MNPYLGLKNNPLKLRKSIHKSIANWNASCNQDLIKIDSSPLNCKIVTRDFIKCKESTHKIVRRPLKRTKDYTISQSKLPIWWKVINHLTKRFWNMSKISLTTRLESKDFVTSYTTQERVTNNLRSNLISCIRKR